MKLIYDAESVSKKTLAYFLSECHYCNIKLSDGRGNSKKNKKEGKLKRLQDAVAEIFDFHFFYELYINYFRILARNDKAYCKDRKELYKFALETIETEEFWNMEAIKKDE